MGINTKKKEFIELITLHGKILQKICRIYGEDEEDRRDLFQEIVGELWRSLDMFSGKSKLTTWLYRVALNTALYHVRKSKKQKPKMETLQELYHNNNKQNGSAEEIENLYRAIDRLNKLDRALVLLVLEQKSYRESAEILGISEANVSVRLVRAKRKLMAIFNETTEA